MLSKRDGGGLEELLHRGFRYALALTHDEPRAEDLVHDAWVAIRRNAGPENAGYLFATIRNRFLDQERRVRLVAVEPLGEEGERTEPAVREDEETFRVDAIALTQALAGLRPEEREALYLTAVEGWGLMEVGERTGRPAGTIASLVSRARRKLALAVGRERERAAR